MTVDEFNKVVGAELSKHFDCVEFRKNAGGEVRTCYLDFETSDIMGRLTYWEPETMVVEVIRTIDDTIVIGRFVELTSQSELLDEVKKMVAVLEKLWHGHDVERPVY